MFAVGVVVLWVNAPLRASGPSYVDMTWVSISNVYYELGSLRILMGGYITRLPQSAFFVPRAYSDPALEKFLASSGVQLITPHQYLDKWRLDRKGVRSVQNDAAKQALGFSTRQGR
jgi:hypothetical protein